MAKEKIQEKGPMDYRQLQEENLSEAQRYVIEQEDAKRHNLYNKNSIYNFNTQSDIHQESPSVKDEIEYKNKEWSQTDNNDWYGKSIWDDVETPYYGDVEDLANQRSEKQWEAFKGGVCIISLIIIFLIIARKWNKHKK